MKHTLRKITVFTVICLFMAVTGCQEDLPEKDPQGITPKSGSEVSYLTEQETADAVAMYNNQMSKVTRAINFTFDGKDFMLLPDQFSKKQYTFMVQHENDSELVFHNVVITDWDGYKKTMLVKYEMTEDFAEKFANGLAGFDDFTGNVTYELLTADEGYPCGETPGAGIPISGGNGPGGGSSGGSGYGSGQPWNPSGNGNPYNQDAVNDRFLMMEMEYMSAQFNQPLYAHQSPRNIGEIDRITPEPYSFIPSIDDTTNPCGGGDEIGILLPFVSPQDLCNELKAKSLNPDFQGKIAELKTKAGTQNFESAYAIYQNAIQGTLFSNEFTGNTNTANGGQVNLTIPTGGTQVALNCIGFMHCHLDNGTTYKIFSYSDLIAFVDLAATSTRPTKELCLYVTTASGTFALKINNEISLINKKQTILKPLNDLVNEMAFNRNVKIGDPIDKQVLGFLKFLKEIGISEINLYQQDSNNDWKKLELNNLQTNFNSTNC